MSFEGQIQDLTQEVVLLGSDNSMRRLNLENTAVYKFVGTPVTRYCLEYKPSPDNPEHTETLFIDNSNVYDVLQTLGFTAISKMFPSSSQQEIYELAGNESEPLEWDIMDETGRESLSLMYFGETGSETYPECTPDFDEDIPVAEEDSPTVTIEHKGRDLVLHRDNCEVFIFEREEHEHLSFITVYDTNQNGEPVRINFFNNRELLEILCELQFNRNIAYSASPYHIYCYSQVVMQNDILPDIDKLERSKDTD